MSETHEDHLRRVRRICESLPGSVEKISHGAPTFFLPKGVFAIFVNNHHADGRIAVWLPAAPGLQIELVQTSPDVFFKPPYVGVKGWIGIQVDRISDGELASYIREAWRLIDAKNKRRK